MKLRAVMAAAFALFVVAPAFSQGGGTQGDPITGNWGADGLTYLELLHNREGVVTGTTIWRHSGGHEERTRITKGTFDAETGRLQLAGEAKNRDGELVQYLIVGRLERGTLAGTYQVGTDKGEFTFTRQ
ncbi:MAG TPA: hypothetical protein VK911_05355 [Vicinamibacterales bacterium]|nr:hypothetical protein [Vicinamibacterales bacterium]